MSSRALRSLWGLNRRLRAAHHRHVVREPALIVKLPGAGLVATRRARATALG
jgi:hypothetical protein